MFCAFDNDDANENVSFFMELPVRNDLLSTDGTDPLMIEGCNEVLHCHHSTEYNFNDRYKVEVHSIPAYGDHSISIVESISDNLYKKVEPKHAISIVGQNVNNFLPTKINTEDMQESANYDFLCNLRKNKTHKNIKNTDRRRNKFNFQRNITEGILTRRRLANSVDQETHKLRLSRITTRHKMKIYANKNVNSNLKTIHPDKKHLQSKLLRNGHIVRRKQKIKSDLVIQQVPEKSMEKCTSSLDENVEKQTDSNVPIVQNSMETADNFNSNDIPEDQPFDDVKENRKRLGKQYSCHICSVLTSCKGAYKTHLLRKHNLIFIYACALCDMNFESMGLLIKHRKSEHYCKERNAFQCFNCEKVFKVFHKLLYHVKVIHKEHLHRRSEFCVDKNYKLCKNDSDASSLIVFKPVKTDNHQFRKKPPNKKPYKTSVCHICGKTFNFLGQFKEHLLKHADIKNYICEICQKAFISRRILTIHQKIHESISERKYICGFIFDNTESPTNIQEPILSEDINGEHILDELSSKPPIDKRNNSAELENRLKAHSAYIILDEFGRRICNFACVSQSDLNKHKLIHLNLKPYKCLMCSMSFRQSAHLRRHVKRHSGTKEFKCDVCKMEFVTKDNLNNHVRTHSDVLPFICEVCGKTFVQKTQCLKHLRKCHPSQTTPVMPFK